MIDNLFRKKVYKSGAIRYIPIFQRWSGDPKDGIWYVAKEKGIKSFRWICERLADLPKARKFAELEPYRTDIAKIVSSRSSQSINEIVTKIFEILIK